MRLEYQILLNPPLPYWLDPSLLKAMYQGLNQLMFLQGGNDCNLFYST